jgi:Beta-ketoacyl synthase, N-terminal domain
MRWIRFGRDAAPRFTAFGMLTPADRGTPEVTIDLPALCGESPLRFRRFDRYGELGYAAARLALRAHRSDGDLPPVAGEAADMDRGVILGSSLACWESNARHQRSPRDPAAGEASAATFVRTVANSVCGDVSIALRFGGPGALFAGGWTAGAEAIIAAASALAERRARMILAGGVEAPGPELRAMHAGGGRGDAQAGRWFTGLLAEAAAIAVMESADEGGAGPGSLRLFACGRAHDPDRRLSIAALLDAPAPVPLGTVVIANTMPRAFLDRAREEAAPRPVIDLPDRAGELGAAGAPAAAALADGLGGGEGVLVVARDIAGGMAALVLGR